MTTIKVNGSSPDLATSPMGHIHLRNCLSTLPTVVFGAIRSYIEEERTIGFPQPRSLGCFGRRVLLRFQKPDRPLFRLIHVEHRSHVPHVEAGV